MKKLHNYLLLILVAILVTGCNNSNGIKETSFDKTLKTHLDAIINGNLAELAPTVDDNVILISPEGDMLKSKKSFMKLHEKWFKLKNWKWTPKTITKQSNDSVGHVLLQYNFTMKDTLGNTIVNDNNYLLLMFRNSKKGWQLVHDQNTKIKQRP